MLNESRLSASNFCLDHPIVSRLFWILSISFKFGVEFSYSAETNKTSNLELVCLINAMLRFFSKQNFHI